MVRILLRVLLLVEMTLDSRIITVGLNGMVHLNFLFKANDGIMVCRDCWQHNIRLLTLHPFFSHDSGKTHSVSSTMDSCTLRFALLQQAVQRRSQSSQWARQHREAIVSTISDSSNLFKTQWPSFTNLRFELSRYYDHVCRSSQCIAWTCHLNRSNCPWSAPLPLDRVTVRFHKASSQCFTSTSALHGKGLRNVALLG